MEPKDLIRNLTQVEEKYKNRVTGFGEICISDMAEDCRKCVERLLARVEELEAEKTSQQLSGRIKLFLVLEPSRSMTAPVVAIKTSLKEAYDEIDRLQKKNGGWFVVQKLTFDGKLLGKETIK
jgi:hypothetical protein